LVSLIFGGNSNQLQIDVKNFPAGKISSPVCPSIKSIIHPAAYNNL